ncbi:Uu.00g122880.m01.CDS01 [Anthostomella pinea]|uniref:Uu.00g122880.m01.CDS01 n=1 Tax=Anthostomella pinea TaxID=933095 RepID=A0AAI8VH70_9PEZI|nr:Uu.00g122880.m01.CDS01 [Anthostomella pinea]
MSATYGYLSMFYHQLTFRPAPLPTSTNLSGQKALITGSNTGLGLAAARELASHGLSRLILGVRSVSKGAAAAASIISESPGCAVEVWPLDQDDWGSVVMFARRARDAFGDGDGDGVGRLDFVLLNAGVKRLEYTTASTGHEAHVQTNHLATALLSLLLLDPLRRTARRTGRPGRMSITGSSVFFYAPVSDVAKPAIIPWLDDRASFKAGSQDRYCLSKLLLVLWVRELAARVDGADVVVNVLNPGWCVSEFHRADPATRAASRWGAYSAVQGGHCLVDAVVRHEGSHGGYVSEQKVKPVSNFVLSADGKAAQKRLWDETMAVFRTECPGDHLDEFQEW